MTNERTYLPWVKKLGQAHLYRPGASVTLCGMPMLGNNYHAYIPEEERKLCPKCFNQEDANE